MMKKYLFIPVFALLATIAQSQTAEVGFFGGLSYYLGDLNPGIHFLGSRPAYGALARVNLDSRWTVKGNFYRGRVIGDDAKGSTNDQRGLKFESKLTDISVTMEFNFFDYITGSRKKTMTPYIFGGIGMEIFNPESDGVYLRNIGTEGQNVGFNGREKYSRVAFTIPFGIGMKYSINRRIALTAEWGMRKIFSDYVDDVSTTYYLNGSGIDPANSDQFLSDPTQLHQPLEQRGDPATRDWCNYTGMTVTYKFRLYNKDKCPNEWKSN